MFAFKIYSSVLKGINFHAKLGNQIETFLVIFNYCAFKATIGDSDCFRLGWKSLQTCWKSWFGYFNQRRKTVDGSVQI